MRSRAQAIRMLVAVPICLLLAAVGGNQVSQADPDASPSASERQVQRASGWTDLRVTGGVLQFRLASVPERLVQGAKGGQLFRIETRAVGRPSPVAMDTVLEFRPAPESQWALVKPILALRKITINGRNYTGSYPESVCNALGRAEFTKCGVVGPPIDRRPQRRDVRLTLVGITTDAPVTGTLPGAVRVSVRAEGERRPAVTEWIPVSYVIKKW